ncbi:MAG: hypothetical protein AAGD12_14410 [Pseudomonadota bacterium]
MVTRLVLPPVLFLLAACAETGTVYEPPLTAAERLEPRNNAPNASTPLAREEPPSNLPENALEPQEVTALLSGVDLSCFGDSRTYGIAFQNGGGLTIRGFRTNIRGSWTPTRGGIEYRLWSMYEADNEFRWLYVALHPRGIQLGGDICVEI